MFEGIGNIGTYAKMQMMKQRAQKNINTGFAFTKKDDEQQQFKIISTKPKKSTGSTFRLKLIKGKLTRGKKLSQGDLDYLRQNAPQLYTKALKITQDRENLEQRLKSCKTKEEAMQVRRSAISSTATPSISGDGASSDAGGGADSCSSGGASASSADSLVSTDLSSGADAAAPDEDCAAIGALAESGEAAVVSIGDSMPQEINSAAYSAAGLSEMANAIAQFNSSNDNDIELPEEILRQRALEDAWLEYAKGRKYRDLALTEQERQKRKKHRKISIEI